MERKPDIFDDNTVKKLQEALSVMGDERKPGNTRKQVVALLKDDIRKLLAQGFTYEDVVRVLDSNGFQVAVPTLREYLKGGKPKRAGKRNMGKTLMKKPEQGGKPVVESPIVTPKPGRTSAALDEDA